MPSAELTLPAVAATPERGLWRCAPRSPRRDTVAFGSRCHSLRSLLPHAAACLPAVGSTLPTWGRTSSLTFAPPFAYAWRVFEIWYARGAHRQTAGRTRHTTIQSPGAILVGAPPGWIGRMMPSASSPKQKRWRENES